MKFNIIEENGRKLSELYPLFKKEFLNPNNSVKDVKRILNLSNAEYKHLREDLKQETGIDIKPNPYNKYGKYDNPYTYIHKRGNVWEIRKGRVYYGRFKTLTDAQKHRDKLKKVNWDKSKL